MNNKLPEFMDKLIEDYAKAEAENRILKTRVKVLENMLLEYRQGLDNVIDTLETNLTEEERDLNSVVGYPGQEEVNG